MSVPNPKLKQVVRRLEARLSMKASFFRDYRLVGFLDSQESVLEILQGRSDFPESIKTRSDYNRANALLYRTVVEDIDRRGLRQHLVVPKVSPDWNIAFTEAEKERASFGYRLPNTGLNSDSVFNLVWELAWAAKSKFSTEDEPKKYIHRFVWDRRDSACTLPNDEFADILYDREADPYPPPIKKEDLKGPY